MAMDPSTANARIRLSSDNSVLEILKDPLAVRDHPDRFDISLATLGTTGYSSGRQYWEINVAAQPCYHLGFASGSAQRRGIIQFRPVQGYWTIILNKVGNFRALDTTLSVIPVQDKPVTVGILLDYKKGQVSFYDAGRRSHMYSFTGQEFTDEIYPFFNFCDEEVGLQIPVVIVTPGQTDWIQ